MTNSISKFGYPNGLKNDCIKKRKLYHGDVKNGEKVKAFRIQGEYGPKKFIKP